MRRLLLGACLLLLLLSGSSGRSEADYWLRPYSVSYYSPYYYPTRVYYYPAPAVYYYCPTPLYMAPLPYAPDAAVKPIPPASGPGYAKPSAAPPSGTAKEPPVGKSAGEGPRVIESKTYSVAEGSTVRAKDADGKDVCKVGFWNISGAEVQLTVNGKVHMVPSNRSLTLSLGREFTYQVNNQAPAMERVPDDKIEHEIVLR